MARNAKSPSAAMNELRAFGLGFPGAHTKSPWPGHLDLAVKGKTFAFMSTDGEAFSLTCKLPNSGVAALMFPFASAAAYGLGKSGWVNAKFDDGVTPPTNVLQVFKEWIEESYRATAPKKLAAARAAERGVAPVDDVLERAAKKKATASKKATAKVTPKKKGPAKRTRPGKKTAAKKGAPKKKAAPKR
jgi:predicted DNA-binding protein (MmcQ/YjbR family)